jgi:hypothetical protein
MNRICRILIKKNTLCVLWELCLFFWFWIEPSLSSLINGFLTVVAILHSLAFLLGLEVNVTHSFTISFPKSIFFYFTFIHILFLSFITKGGTFGDQKLILPFSLGLLPNSYYSSFFLSNNNCVTFMDLINK